MKKTLAIVLALVMVLAMIPAMSAAVEETITISDRAYDLKLWSCDANGKDKAVYAESKTNVNSITLEYIYENLGADVTGKWTEDTAMGMLVIGDLKGEWTNPTITVDGKELKVDALAGYYAGYDSTGKTISIPLELTKAGYTDTFLVQISEKSADGTKLQTEIIKVSVVLKNVASYKGEKTAYITDIQSSNEKIMEAYIVGDKIYMDWASDALTHTGWAGESLTITFANENKAPFSVITYASDVNESLKLAAGSEVKLKDSAAKYLVKPASLNGAEDIQFALETKEANYLTKKYDVVIRGNIADEDPKGIYFAETTKTIAMGEKFKPVVLAVATGSVVKADAFHYGTNTSKEVIDIDGDTVIGTREGVAYITAEYTPFNGVKYESSSMKVIVTLPGESIPAVEPSAEIYYVTCRNLNVRAGGSTSYKKVDMIHRGDAVKVLEIKNGWAKLDNGTYVCAKYIAK